MTSVVISMKEALSLGERALLNIGYSLHESEIIAANLVDAELCGYPGVGLARLLTIAEDFRSKLPRTPVKIVRETPASALIDGGNYVGLYSLQVAAEVAVAKARANGIALVGLYNSYLSGRLSRYLELIARAGLVGIHLNSSHAFVVPPGGKRPVLGTNPLAIAIPRAPDPLIFDMGTSAIPHGDIVLAARLGRALPEGAAVDENGEPTRDAAAALEGGVLPFGGHKGFGFSLMVQALCLMAGSQWPAAHVPGYGFLFIAFQPELLVLSRGVRDRARLVASASEIISSRRHRRRAKASVRARFSRTSPAAHPGD